MSGSRKLLRWSIACGMLRAMSLCDFDTSMAGEKASAKAPAKQSVDGREIFAREWIPGDKRSHGGDGLGPMFNESSCIACHNQGGVGGAGPAGKNVDIVTAFNNQQQQGAQPQSIPRQPRTLPEQLFRSFFGDLDPAMPEPPQTIATTAASPAERAAQEKTRREADRKVLAKLHPGFAFAPSVVLHRNATYADYDAWRMQMGGMNFGVATSAGADLQFFGPETVQAQKGRSPRSVNGQQLMQMMKQEMQMAAAFRGQGFSQQHGSFAVVRSQRNTTALFGAGAIDAIPVALLEELELKQAAQGQVSGRVARLKDDKAGRFGWKSQTATLRDFVLTACAVELGLNVPDHPQAGVPQKPDYKAPGLDLNQAECDALIDYVGNLPSPQQRDLSEPSDAAFVNAGRKLFEQVGCAECHVADVGDAAGIYSDLLLHDLGPELGDTGSYGVFVPNSTPEGDAVPLEDLAQRGGSGVKGAQQKITGATRQEWRTPPLWGVRDSAPYLHDGRAATLEQAIAIHGGEAQRSAQAFFNLQPQQRFQVVTFLKSLVAPDQVALAK